LTSHLTACETEAKYSRNLKSAFKSVRYWLYNSETLLCIYAHEEWQRVQKFCRKDSFPQMPVIGVIQSHHLGLFILSCFHIQFSGETHAAGEYQINGYFFSEVNFIPGKLLDLKA